MTTCGTRIRSSQARAPSHSHHPSKNLSKKILMKRRNPRKRKKSRFLKTFFS